MVAIIIMLISQPEQMKVLNEFGERQIGDLGRNLEVEHQERRRDGDHPVGERANSFLREVHLASFAQTRSSQPADSSAAAASKVVPRLALQALDGSEGVAPRIGR
jgi:hypothetical protein